MRTYHRYHRRCCALSCVLIAGLLAGSASADEADQELPLPVLAQRAHLVVIGELATQSEPEERMLRLPDLSLGGYERPLAQRRLLRHTLRTCTIDVEELLRSTVPNADAKTVFTFYTHPPLASETKDPRWRTPKLKTGKSYLFILRYNDDGKTFYLPPNGLCAIPLKKVEKVLGKDWRTQIDPEQWTWGDADASGMSLAAIVRGAPQRSDDGITLRMLLALRNGTDTVQTINVHGGLRPISVQLSKDGSDAEATPQSVDLYARFANVDPRSVPRLTLGPGQIAMIGESGSMAWWSRAQLAPESEGGTYTLQAEYRVERPRGEAFQNAFWTGAVKSAPLRIEIPKGR